VARRWCSLAFPARHPPWRRRPISASSRRRCRSRRCWTAPVEGRASRSRPGSRCGSFMPSCRPPGPGDTGKRVAARASGYLGRTIEATRRPNDTVATELTVTWLNELDQAFLPNDPTLMGAVMPGAPPPIVTHLHGGENLPQFDGTHQQRGAQPDHEQPCCCVEANGSSTRGGNASHQFAMRCASPVASLRRAEA
jgi:hypothetical protein